MSYQKEFEKDEGVLMKDNNENVIKEKEQTSHFCQIKNIWEFQSNFDKQNTADFFVKNKDGYPTAKTITQDKTTQYTSNYSFNCDSNRNIEKEFKTKERQSQYGLVGIKWNDSKQQKSNNEMNPVFGTCKSLRRKSFRRDPQTKTQKLIKRENSHHKYQQVSQFRPITLRNTQKIEENVKDQEISCKIISQRPHTDSRQLAIFSHKQLSNMNKLIRQTKELIYLNKLNQFYFESDEIRKKVIQLQIQCRKLKIGLRNSSSCSGALVNLRRKQFIGRTSSRSKYLPTSRSKNFYSIKNMSNNIFPSTEKGEKQRNLLEAIQKQSKKSIELTAREARITNFYHSIRNKNSQINRLMTQVEPKKKSSHHSITQIQNSQAKPKNLRNKRRISEFLSQISSALENKTYQQILTTKKFILINSILESRGYYEKKIECLNSEVQIMKKQNDLLSAHISTLATVEQEIRKKNDQNNEERFIHTFTQTGSFKNTQNSKIQDLKDCHDQDNNHESIKKEQDQEKQSDTQNKSCLIRNSLEITLNGQKMAVENSSFGLFLQKSKQFINTHKQKSQVSLNSKQKGCSNLQNSKNSRKSQQYQLLRQSRQAQQNKQIDLKIKSSLKQNYSQNQFLPVNNLSLKQYFSGEPIENQNAKYISIMTHKNNEMSKTKQKLQRLNSMPEFSQFKQKKLCDKNKKSLIFDECSKKESEEPSMNPANNNISFQKQNRGQDCMLQQQSEVIRISFFQKAMQNENSKCSSLNFLQSEDNFLYFYNKVQKI